ncbi:MULTISPECIES: flavodoxin family protein [Stenotrophomonas]|uniref:Flavodoxin family protein n=1 Tax=Stenotrophomonas maltophilia TaxID=40324 RepID=A0A3S0J1D5_STEMA|nr:flavodoxin family protein [Stenotrophomonas maltophilia]RTQ91724.1 flavodoxin family protein [Stenotrophomonas maltophilia]
MSSVRIAVVYHSTYGHTARQAKAVREGVEQVPGAEAVLYTVEEAQRHWDDLALVDGIIFGTPTYMGNVSAAFKAFQEVTSPEVMSKGAAWQNKIAAGFTNSGAHAGDKLGTLIQLAVFAAQHGMHWVNMALPASNNSASGSPNDLNRLGFWLGAAAQSNVDETAETAPPESDLATARHLGERVAVLALHVSHGRSAFRSAA